MWKGKRMPPRRPRRTRWRRKKDFSEDLRKICDEETNKVVAVSYETESGL